MKVNNHLLAMTLVLLMSLPLHAQDVKFGKLEKADLLMEEYPEDPDAPAVVLYRDRNTRFNYIQGEGFHLVTYVHERVKIFKEEGLEYATVSERLYQGNDGDEGLTGLKGYTYNLVGGKVERSKLKGSDTFSESVSKYYDKETFTMPEVKAGSVIEYEYRLSSPYIWRLDDIHLQYDIPIAYQHIKVSIPEYFSYKPMMRGHLSVNPVYSSSTDRIVFSASTGDRYNSSRRHTSQESIEYRENNTEFTMKQVPALEEEPFVNDMDNYRSMISYELQQVRYPNSPLKDYSSNWEKVAKTILDGSDFGDQMKVRKFHKEAVAPFLAKPGTAAEKAVAIYNWVKTTMVWNGYNGYSSENGVKDALEERKGNVGDINLLLIGMLRAAGMDANPVLVSTRDHGIPLFPSISGFNYVVAAVDLDGQRLYLDAVHDFLEPNRVNPNALNWTGRLLRDSGQVEMVSLFPNSPSSNISMYQLAMDEHGVISGKMRLTRTDYRAFSWRKNKLEMDEAAYLEEFGNDHGGMEILSYQRQHDTDISNPLVEEIEFEMDGQTSLVADQLFFSPLLFDALEENPFKRDTREFPVDFNFPWQEKTLMYITLPEGYQVTHLPEPSRIALPDRIGNFTHMVQDMGNGTLQVLFDLKFNQSVVAPQYYPMLKEFFKNIVEKHAEKVVLSKTGTDGTTEGTAGGR